ncbi:MAG: methyl-accepting chemotaxis protein [Bacillota bacterium]
MIRKNKSVGLGSGIQTKSKMKVQLSVVIVLIIAVTISAIGTVNYFNDIDDVVDSKKEANKLMAEVVSRQVQMYLTSSIETLRTFAATTDFDTIDSYTQNMLLGKVVSNNVQFKSVYITDLEGNVTGTTNSRRDNGKNYKSALWHQDASKGKVHISDVMIDKDSSNPVIVVALPIESILKGQTGVIAADLRLDRLFYLTKDMKVGKTGFSYIVDQKGNIIAHPDFKEKVLTKYNAVENGIQGAIEVTKGNNNVMVYEDTEGNKVVGGYAFVPLTMWGVLVEQQYDEIKEQAANTLQRTFMISVIFILLGLLVSMFFANVFTKPLSDMIGVVNKIKDGDLRERIKVNSTNEVGILQQAFNEMADSLAVLIQDVNGAAKQIYQSTKDLESNAQLTSEAAAEIAVTIDEVAYGTEKQIKSVETSTFAVNQMIEGVKSVSENAIEILESSNYASELASKGAEDIEDIVSSMRSIDETVGESAGLIKELSVHTYQISDIVQLIKQISDQTNLLALNAAIEAARAGEHGRGFAVVAEEVRKLADQSAQASTKIVELIKKIQQETDRVVKTMESSLEGVKNGTNVINGTTKSFHSIIEETQKVTQKVEGFAAAIEELTAGMDLVEQSIIEVNQVSQATAASTQVVFASTEEQDHAIRCITDSISGLSKMTENLELVIQRFNTGNQDKSFHIRKEEETKAAIEESIESFEESDVEPYDEPMEIDVEESSVEEVQDRLETIEEQEAFEESLAEAAVSVDEEPVEEEAMIVVEDEEQIDDQETALERDLCVKEQEEKNA